jgi:hypothetical protein
MIAARCRALPLPGSQKKVRMLSDLAHHCRSLPFVAAARAQKKSVWCQILPIIAVRCRCPAHKLCQLLAVSRRTLRTWASKELLPAPHSRSLSSLTKKKAEMGHVQGSAGRRVCPFSIRTIAG